MPERVRRCAKYAVSVCAAIAVFAINPSVRAMFVDHQPGQIHCDYAKDTCSWLSDIEDKKSSGGDITHLYAWAGIERSIVHHDHGGTMSVAVALYKAKRHGPAWLSWWDTYDYELTSGTTTTGREVKAGIDCRSGEQGTYKFHSRARNHTDSYVFDLEGAPTYCGPAADIVTEAVGGG